MKRKMKFENVKNVPSSKGKKRRYSGASDELEDDYEATLLKSVEDMEDEDIKLLLPIKSRDGKISKRISREKVQKEDDVPEEEMKVTKKMKEKPDENADEVISSDPVPTVQLIASREEKLKNCRFQIGVLSSEVLENPEEKVRNIQTLFKFLDERDPQIYITVRKLAMASLMEIFEDILPSYSVVQIDTKGVKLKKDTLKLQQYETSIVHYYKQFLQKLEKMATALKKKKQKSQTRADEIHLGTFAIKCMSQLLATDSYTNFSTNLINFLIPFLDHKLQSVRQLVAESFEQTFKNDKQGDLSAAILRSLNHYIKSRKNIIYSEVVLILLSLQTRFMIYDAKKSASTDAPAKPLNRKEKKGKKKIKEVEKELLETKVKKDEHTKQKISTQITSFLFTIYFRILKGIERGQVLLACLKGLSKFTRFINVDYHQDLINVLDGLLKKDTLSLSEKLHCIYVTFVIRSSQTTTLDVDPERFFTHLYEVLTNLHAGRDYHELDIFMKTLDIVCNFNNITQSRLLGLLKKVSTIALNSQHNVSLGIIHMLRTMIERCPGNLSLYTIHNDEFNNCFQNLGDSAYSYANSSTIWEIIALQRFYHEAVSKYAEYIPEGMPVNGEFHLPIKILKLSPENMYKQYDMSEGQFFPTIKVPEKFSKHTLQNKIRRIDDDYPDGASASNNYQNIFSELRRNMNLQES